MKAKLIIITVLALGSFTVRAQELIAPHHISGTDTVPSDEIWKVESILYDYSPIPNATNSTFKLNGKQIYCRTTSWFGNSSLLNSIEIKLPFWLNSGDVVENLNNIGYISVLRFKKPD